MSGVTQTSIYSYKYNVETGILKKQALKAYEFITFNPGSSLREIANSMNKVPSSICGAMSELYKRGLIVKGDKKICKTSGRRVEQIYQTGEIISPVKLSEHTNYEKGLLKALEILDSFKYDIIAKVRVEAKIKMELNK